MNLEQVQNINLKNIKPDPDNRRIGGFDTVKLQELADSIRDIGVQVPIILRLNPDPSIKADDPPYEIVAGERRWRASALAGKDSIPSIVRYLDDLQVLKIRYIENGQRDDMHPLDEASGFVKLIAKAGLSADQIAAEIGKSPSFVYGRIKLLDLVPEARQLFEEGTITTGHALLIARLAPEQQAFVLADGDCGRALYDYEENVIPVRELKEWIENNIMLELSTVTWDLSDTELIPEAGSCIACPKRTGFQPRLFEDIADKDHCTDRECFKAKSVALVERRRSELIAKGEDFLQVSDGYNNGNNVGTGVLARYQWEECEAKAKGAKPALVVAGETPGRLTYGIERKDTGPSYKKTAEEKAEEDREKLKRVTETKIRHRTFDAIINASAGKDFTLEIWTLITLRYWNRIDNNTKKIILTMEGCKKPEGQQYGWEEELGARHIETMDLQQLHTFMLKLALVQDYNLNQYVSIQSSKLLEKAATLFDIDAAAIAKEVKAKAKEKEKTTKDKPKEKKGIFALVKGLKT